MARATVARWRDRRRPYHCREAGCGATFETQRAAATHVLFEGHRVGRTPQPERGWARGKWRPRPVCTEKALDAVAHLDARHPRWNRQRHAQELRARGLQMSDTSVGRMLAHVRRHFPVCGGCGTHNHVVHTNRTLIDARLAALQGP